MTVLVSSYDSTIPNAMEDLMTWSGLTNETVAPKCNLQEFEMLKWFREGNVDFDVRIAIGDTDPRRLENSLTSCMDKYLLDAYAPFEDGCNVNADESAKCPFTLNPLFGIDMSGKIFS